MDNSPLRGIDEISIGNRRQSCLAGVLYMIDMYRFLEAVGSSLSL